MLNTRSYSLIRTNPKLSGNIKIIIDANELPYLESFDANPTLGLTRYKHFQVNANGKYASDLYRFFDNGTTPKNTIFEVGREFDDRIIYSEYSSQYEMMYSYGARQLVSNQYSELYSILAPLWINSKNIPKKFVIFAVDGARTKTPKTNVTTLAVGISYRVSGADFSVSHDGVTYQNGQIFKASSGTYSIVSGSGIVYQDDTTAEFIQNSDPKNIYLNNIDNARIVKVYDLSEQSAIGKYLLNSVNDELFPDTPLFVDFQNKLVEYRGIDVTTGVFSAMSDNLDLDREYGVFELDKLISEGFERKGLAVANLFNIEFAFDDTDAEEFKFYRYYGFYTDDIDLATFKIDYNKTFDGINGKYYNQFYGADIIPNFLTIPVSDPDGIKVYPDTYKNFSGLILNPTEIQNTESIFYIKDKNLRYRKLQNSSNIINKELVLSDNSCEYVDLSYFKNEIEQPATIATKKGKSSTFIKINGDFITSDKIDIFYKNTLLGTVIADHLPDWIDTPYGESDNINYYFYPTGSPENIALAMSKAIRFLAQINNIRIDATAIDQYVVISCLDFGLGGNNYRINQQLESESVIDIFSKQLVGGTDSAASRLIIDADILLTIDKDSYVKIESGYAKILHIAPYVDEPIFDGFRHITNFSSFLSKRALSIVPQNEAPIINNNNNCLFYNTSSISFGIMSIYDVMDFDFDTLSSDYNRIYDNEYYKYFNSQILVVGNTYQVLRYPNTTDVASISMFDGSTTLVFNEGDMFVATSTSYTVLTGQTIILDERYSNDSELKKFPGFNTLGDQINIITQDESSSSKFANLVKEKITEYDLLKENDLEQYALVSKVVPHVNKWVLNNATDIRDNGYRLNLSQSFGQLNFTPSFIDESQNPKYFTHEWYYLSGIPENIRNSDLLASNSYMNDIFDIELYNNLKYDYFTKYFSVNRFILDDTNAYDIIDTNKQDRFTLFGPDNVNKYSTIFRGVKVNISTKTGVGADRFNNYKFSCILNINKTDYLNPRLPVSYEIVENKVFGSIVLIVNITLDDYKILPNLSKDIRPDYLSLYVLESLKRWEELPQGGIGYLYGLKFPLPTLLYQSFYKEGSYGQLKINDFRGIQLFRDTDYGTGPTSLLKIIRFQQWYPINFDIKPTNEVADLSYFTGKAKGELGRLLALNKVGAAFLTETSCLDPLDVTKIIFNRPNTLLKISGNYDVELSNKGLSVLNMPDISSQVNDNPLNVHKSIYPLTGLTWFYENGGFEAYTDYINLISFGSIFDNINNNSKFVSYKTITEDGISDGSDFLIILEQPVKINLKSGLQLTQNSTLLPEYPNETYIKTTNDISEDSISLFRYSGAYTPKFKQLLKFKDDYFINRWSSLDIIWSEAEFKWYDSNTTVAKINWINTLGNWISHPESWNDVFIDKNKLNDNLIPLFSDLARKNTRFDIESSDFGMLQNYYHHRVNISGMAILKSINPIYRSMDEIAIKSLSHNIFASSWDSNYFLNSIARFNDSYDHGMKEMLEKPSFFSSKILITPESIPVSDLTSNIDVNIQSVDYINITDVAYERKESQIILRLDLNERLRSYIFNSIKQTFIDELDQNYVIGDVELATNNYIDLNILPTYIISTFNIYIKKYRDGSLPIINNIGIADALNSGYEKAINLQNQPINKLESILTYAADNTYFYSFVLEVKISKI